MQSDPTEIPSAPAVDDVDNLLNEFDNSVAPVQPGAGNARQPVHASGDDPAAATSEQQPPIPLTYAEKLLKAVADRDQRLRDHLRPREPVATPDAAPQASQELTALKEWAVGVEQERAAERERVEAERVFGEARSILKDAAPYLPDDYAKTWFVNEAQTDDALASAWENRHASPEHGLHAQRQIAKAMRRFTKHLASLPDPGLSEDRRLVTAAVKGASLGKEPPPKQVTFKGMSDPDFAAYTEKIYGFRPF